MNIGIVGLGLIGGSLAKTIKRKTKHKVLGADISLEVQNDALELGAIDERLDKDSLCLCHIVFVCLHPEATVDFMLENKLKFKKGSIVADVCGVKEYIENKVDTPLKNEGVHYIGTHPMAGREFSGFSYSKDDLFDKASFIITKNENTDEKALDTVKKLAEELGFRETVISDSKEHDKIIAFTSQLAHVVSNAYIKSPTAALEHGFSAGSFQDLTRVAFLNEGMWTQLFLANRENLSREIGILINNLSEYKKAIDENNSKVLSELLKAGRIIKERTIKKDKK